MHIAPHPLLEPARQANVARDYGMEEGEKVLDVRYAMLFYVLKRLTLLGRPENLSAKSQHIVVVNRKGTDAALERAKFFV